MKTNMRYIYSMFVSVVGVWSIKQLYFFLVNRKELDLYLMDYLSVGTMSGLFPFYIVFGWRVKYLLLGLVIGSFYGFVYNKMINHFSKVKQTRAEKLGIKL